MAQVPPEYILMKLKEYGGFRSARLKQERANVHIDALEATIAEYLATNPIRENAIYEEPQLTSWIEVHALPPQNTSAMIGDAIHNLRTALDLLASDAVRLNGGDPSDVYFPFAKNDGEIDKMIAKRKIDLAGQAVVDLVKSLKPYVGGNADLRGIHDLDILDKHQTLIPALSTLATPHVTSGQGFDDFRLGRLHTLEVYVSEAMRETSLAHLGTDMPVVVPFVFPDRLPFAGQDIVPTLKSLSQTVLGVIESFELLLFGAVAKGPAA